MNKHESTSAEKLRSIVDQTAIEYELLGSARDSLVASISCKGDGDALRSAWTDYQSRVEQMLLMEESDSYMICSLGAFAPLSERVNKLRQEHDAFRGEMLAISAKLGRLMPTDHAAFVEITTIIAEFLHGFANHCQKDVLLLEVALEGTFPAKATHRFGVRVNCNES